MKSLLSAFIVGVGIVILGLVAMYWGDSVANDGLARLNDRYEGKCVSVGEGLSAKVISIRPKEIRLAVTAADGTSSIRSIPRAPLDAFIVKCPE